MRRTAWNNNSFAAPVPRDIQKSFSQMSLALIRRIEVHRSGLNVEISLPRRLYEEAVKRGLETWIIEALSKELGLDPKEEAELYLELAKKLFVEAKKLLEKGDIAQSSEKLYKVAEESIKAMAEALGIEESEKAKRKGRWTLRLLNLAAKALSERVNKRIYDDWDHAYFLHVEGFHEARLGKDQVEARVPYVEELLSIAAEVVLKAHGKGSE